MDAEQREYAHGRQAFIDAAAIAIMAAGSRSDNPDLYQPHERATDALAEAEILWTHREGQRLAYEAAGKKKES